MNNITRKEVKRALELVFENHERLNLLLEWVGYAKRRGIPQSEIEQMLGEAIVARYKSEEEEKRWITQRD